jgi:hypothetical protein
MMMQLSVMSSPVITFQAIGTNLPEVKLLTAAPNLVAR